MLLKCNQAPGEIRSCGEVGCGATIDVEQETAYHESKP